MDDIDTVYQAVAFLNGTDGASCKEASNWLGQFQKTVRYLSFFKNTMILISQISLFIV